MAGPGAPRGNNNAGKAKDWENAIRRALARAEAEGSGKCLNRLADQLLTKAAEGDMAALKEIGDRLDGKPAQVIAGDPEAPVYIREVMRTIVDPRNPDASGLQAPARPE